MNDKPFTAKKIGYTISIPWELLSPSPFTQRPSHLVTTHKTDEWLAAREKFVSEWESMQQQGLNEGFLEQEACYECGGQVIPTTNTEDTKWVYDDKETK